MCSKKEAIKIMNKILSSRDSGITVVSGRHPGKVFGAVWRRKKKVFFWVQDGSWV